MHSATTMAVEEDSKVSMTEKSTARVDIDVGETQAVPSGAAHLQRKLGGKEVQLFAVGGAIGTSMLAQPLPWKLCDQAVD
jgi:amino acid transporter